MHDPGNDLWRQTKGSEHTQAGAPRDPRVREHVKARMRELLIAGTTAGIGLSATLCSISCDPLPPPQWTCADSPADLRLYPYAQWHLTDSLWVIEVSMDLNSVNAVPALKLTGNPVMSGARLLGTATVDSISAKFTCIPDSGSAKMQFELPMRCAANSFSYKAEIDTTGTQPIEGGGIPVSRIN